jgi:hypothetical protein
MSGRHLQNAVDPSPSASQCTHTARSCNRLSKTISTDTGSTIVESVDACRSNNEVTKFATIIDIDTTCLIPLESLTFQRPSIHDLTKAKGPSTIMKEAKPHKAHLQWIHLRANCMGWIEDLMDKVCEERGIPIQQTLGSPSKPPQTIRNPLLRQDLWSKLFHGRSAKSIHARFMRPMCTPFAIDLEDEESDSNGLPKRSRDNLVLFLPYLHWESCEAWLERQELIRNILNGEYGYPYADGEFVKKYLKHSSPLHDRRSLHQAYYYNLA